MTQNDQRSPLREQLTNLGVELVGEWSQDELQRISMIFQRLANLGGFASLENLFNQQITNFHHGHRPGKVGRTRGGDIFLDNEWTDWTMAHELGHRWNNAWDRQPEQTLRRVINAGRFEWMKRQLRRFEKWLSQVMGKLGIQTKLDWKDLWYHPGEAPPPCGVDRNFNASEDLAESFASIIFPEDAKIRAAKAANRLSQFSAKWDWGKNFTHFHLTPRGKITLQMIRERLHPNENLDQPNQTAA
jgi:hypothetical protein